MNLQDAETLANELIAKYLTPDWKFAWNRSKRCFGVCSFRKKQIQLSNFVTLYESETKIKDTILHEIAHALAGHAAKHGARWKLVAQSIGAKPRASDTFSKETCENLYQYGIVDPDGKIVKGYMRKPNASTYAKVPNMYLVSSKEETLGKLKIVKL